MEIIERTEMLEALVAATGGEIEIRKLHELAYLCQMAGDNLGQDFVCFLYSLSSPSLSLDIDRAIQWGLLEQKHSPDGSLTICFCVDPSQVAIGTGFVLARQLTKEPLRVLDLLSTIVYLDKVGYSGEGLMGKLEELKGRLGEFERAVWCLAAEHFRIEYSNVSVVN